MDHVSIMYGTFMDHYLDHEWVKYGSDMVHAWIIYGPCDGSGMEHCWIMYDPCMDHAWTSYGYCMDQFWIVYGSRMDRALITYETRMCHVLISHATRIDQVCVMHGSWSVQVMNQILIIWWTTFGNYRLCIRYGSRYMSDIDQLRTMVYCAFVHHLFIIYERCRAHSTILHESCMHTLWILYGSFMDQCMCHPRITYDAYKCHVLIIALIHYWSCMDHDVDHVLIKYTSCYGPRIHQACVMHGSVMWHLSTTYWSCIEVVWIIVWSCVDHVCINCVSWMDHNYIYIYIV